MDNFLERNLIFLPRYNQELTDKIANLEFLNHSYTLDSAESGNAIIYIDGLPTNDIIDPLAEAEKIFKSVENNPDDFYVLTGIETGYIFEHFAANCKGCTILFEPCVDSLRIAFELIDFSVSLRKDKVFVITNEDELDNILAFRRKSESKITLLANKFYEFAYKNELAQMRTHINKVLSEKPSQRAIF